MKRQWLNRRIVVRAVKFLLLGAVVNVAVAWVCAASAMSGGGLWRFCGDPRSADAPSFMWTRRFGYERISRTDGYRIMSVDGDTELAPGKYTSVVWWPPDALEDVFSTHTAAGWPFRSVRGWVATNIVLTPVDASVSPVGVAPPPQRPDIVRWGWVCGTESVSGERVLLPLLPIPAGFMMNSVVWGVLIAGAYMCRRGIVRFTRSRRGQCPACAYPMGTSPVCTECGESLPGRTTP